MQKHSPSNVILLVFHVSHFCVILPAVVLDLVIVYATTYS